MVSKAHASKLLKILLLIILLAAQGYALAHSVDHAASGDTTYCSTCLVGNHSNCAIDQSHESIPIVPLTQATAPRSDCTICRGSEELSDARAPPFS
jgi:hypothetical protein